MHHFYPPFTGNEYAHSTLCKSFLGVFCRMMVTFHNWVNFLAVLLTKLFFCCLTRVCMKKSSQERFALKILLDRPKARNEVLYFIVG